MVYLQHGPRGKLRTSVKCIIDIHMLISINNNLPIMSKLFQRHFIAIGLLILYCTMYVCTLHIHSGEPPVEA